MLTSTHMKLGYVFGVHGWSSHISGVNIDQSVQFHVVNVDICIRWEFRGSWNRQSGIRQMYRFYVYRGMIVLLLKFLFQFMEACDRRLKWLHSLSYIVDDVCRNSFSLPFLSEEIIIKYIDKFRIAFEFDRITNLPDVISFIR